MTALLVLSDVALATVVFLALARPAALAVRWRAEDPARLGAFLGVLGLLLLGGWSFLVGVLLTLAQVP